MEHRTDASDAWVDIGHDVWIRPFSGGYFIRHPDPTKADLSATPGWCVGSVFTEDARDRPKWTIEQQEPLTLSPSIRCLGQSCGGMHGYIRNGRWEPC